MPDNAATGAGNSDVTKRDNICSNCGVTETVLWRLSKLNDRIVCNAWYVGFACSEFAFSSRSASSALCAVSCGDSARLCCALP